MHTSASLLACWLIVVAAFDFSSRRVPNWLVGSGLMVALWGLVTGLQPFGISAASALLASFVIFGIFLIFYATGLMGAGDVKFAAVLGLWFGHELLMQVFVLGSLLACLHALFVLIRQSPRLMQLWPSAMQLVPEKSPKKDTKSRQIPYAAYLAMSGLMTFI